MNYYLYKNFWRFAGAPHCEEKVTADEARQMLSQGGFLVRNTYQFDCQDNTTFWYIIKDSFGGLDELSHKTRQKVRKAMSAIDYRIVDKGLIKSKGFSIYKESLKSFHDDGSALAENAFNALVEADTTECWACFDKATDTMVGFSLNSRHDDACSYELTAILPEYRKNGSYIYYGLTYIKNEYYLDKLNLRYVSDGSRSVTEHSGIQEWLIENFGFRKAYCHLDIYYKWWMKAAVGLLYPFKKIITMPRVKAVLNMEAMRRGEK